MAAASQLLLAPVKEGEILAAKYRIEKVIGVGGMGVVVSAMHLELEKRVALKFLLPQAQASDELIGRFMREAKSSVKLKGAHVAQTLDVGRLDDGRAYIVMEFLDGKDLGQEIKAAAGVPFAIEDAISWTLQACEGLAEAHALGIVHRDLKPANLFLSRTGDKKVVKVLDFGISKSINPTSSDMLSLTKTEMLLGSPLYMAPEQMRSSKYVDERSDIWSLGAVAYELLTGHVPFEAETLLDLCFKVAQESCVAAIEVRPDIPQALSDAVMRCLEKDATLRWDNVGELAAAIEPFARATDRGAGARTAGVLAAADPKLRARAESQVPASPRPEPDAPPPAKPKVSAKAASKRHVVRHDDQVITGNAPTERAPYLIDEDGSADNIPASSAWGTTQNEPTPHRRNWRGPIAIAAIGIIVALVSFMVSRSATTPATPPLPPPLPQVTHAPETATPTTAPPLPTPESAATTSGSTASPPATSASVIVSVQPPVTPKPRPKPSASAAPTDSGGFLRVRE